MINLFGDYMISVIYNFSLIAVRLYLFIRGAGFLLVGLFGFKGGEGEIVTGMFYILIAGIMGVLSMPWPPGWDDEEDDPPNSNSPKG